MTERGTAEACLKLPAQGRVLFWCMGNTGIHRKDDNVQEVYLQ